MARSQSFLMQESVKEIGDKLRAEIEDVKKIFDTKIKELNKNIEATAGYFVECSSIADIKLKV